MARSSKTVEIVLALKDSFSKGFGAADSRFKKLGRSVFNLKTALAGLGVGYAGKKLIDIANEQAKAVAGMETALKSMGVYSQETSKALQAAATEIQSFTNFGDEAVLMGQKFLITYQDITMDMMPRTTAAMADLAALMGGDMRGAANMLGKASMGMVGDLKRAGISVNKNTYALEGYLGVLAEIESQSRGQARAQRVATGSMIAMGNSLGDAKEKAGEFLKTMLEPTFKIILANFDALNEQLARLNTDGDMSKWAKNASASILGAAKRISRGVAATSDSLHGWHIIIETLLLAFTALKGKVYKVFAGIQITINKVMTSILDALKGVQTVVNKLQFTKAGRRAALAINAAVEKQEKLNIASKAYTDNLIRQIQANDLLLASTKEELIALIAKESNLDKVNRLWDSIITKQIKSASVKPEAVSTPMGEAGGDPGRGSEIGQMQASLATLQAMTETSLTRLQYAYDEGTVAFGEYWAERKTMMETAMAEELRVSEAAAELERDPEKQLAAETAIFEMQQTHARARLDLIAEETEAEQVLADRKMELQQLLFDTRLEANEMRLSERELAGEMEMEELRRRQEEEMALVEEMTSFIQNEEQKRRIIKGVQRSHDATMTKKQADTDHNIILGKLSDGVKLADGMKDISTGLFEASGKQSKKMFQLQKAASIAQATMKVAEGVAGALGSPPYSWMAMANAAMIAAMGGIQISAIASQQLADGGPVLGHSPHSKADNIPAQLTAGEYVLPVSSVQHYGSGLLEALRQKAIPREIFSGVGNMLPKVNRTGHFATGGQVGRMASSIKESESTGIQIVNVTSPDAVKNLSIDALHENKELVVNMVLDGLEDQNYTLARE